MNDDTTVEIRRYPNRRFYDRSRKQYLTLGEIEALVLEGKTVEVRESRTGEDITRQILTQILMQRQPEKMDVFPVAMLHNVLRANDLAMNLWRSCLRHSMASMETWQKATTPFTLPNDWVSMFLPGFSSPTHSSAPVPTPAPDVDPIARRLDELVERIKRLETEAEVPTNPTADKSIEGVKQRLQQLEKRNGK
jgi:polyhydroxyalkanoate synthesis repressor PhaR